MTVNKKNVLFICTHNSCRSQIAEGLGNHLLGNVYNFYSAGTKATSIDPFAISILKEINIDISNQYSKTTDDLKHIEFHYVITVCNNAQKNCPFIPAKNEHIFIAFQDPPALAKQYNNIDEKIDCYRKVRDEIKKFLLHFHENNLLK